MLRGISVYTKLWWAAAAVVYSLLLYFDHALAQGRIWIGGTPEPALFIFVFVNCVWVSIVFLPLINKKVETCSNKKIKRFLGLPKKGQKLTLPDISEFLSDQALVAFLATAMVVTGKGVLTNYGGLWSGFYVAGVLFGTVILAGTSLIRFAIKLTAYHWVCYALAAFVSISVMLTFFDLGLKLAG